MVVLQGSPGPDFQSVRVRFVVDGPLPRLESTSSLDRGVYVGHDARVRTSDSLRRATVCLGVTALAILAVGCSNAQSVAPTTSPFSTTTESLATNVTSITTTTLPIPATTPSTATTMLATTTTTAALPTVAFEVPAGSLSVGDGDLFVVHDDGDLWLHPGLRNGSPSAPIRLADMGDPRIPVTEGEGPNTVEDVVGEVGGVVYFSACCEPVAGDVRAATGPDMVQQLGYGWALTLSPDRTQLASLNGFGFLVWDLKGGTSTYRELDQTAMPINPWGLSWSSDGQRLIMLYFDEQATWLVPLSASDLLPIAKPTQLDAGFDLQSPPRVQFAGRGPNTEIAVVYYGTATTKISYFDSTTLDEVPGLARELPAGVTSVRLDSDGIGLLWVDHNTLWYLPAAGPARRLGQGYTNAWFAT